MAHAKNIGEPFMARSKNLYNIPWIMHVIWPSIYVYYTASERLH